MQQGLGTIKDSAARLGKVPYIRGVSLENRAGYANAEKVGRALRAKPMKLGSVQVGRE